MHSHAPDPLTPVSGIDEWAELALTELTGLPDVSRVGLAVVEGGGRRLLFTASDRQRGATHEWCHVDALSTAPINDAISTSALLAGPISELDDRYATFVAAQRGTGFVDIAVMPFTALGPAVGGFVLYYSRSQQFDASQHADLHVTAAQLEGLLRAALRRPDALAVADLRSPEGSLVAEHDTPPDTGAVGEARHFLRDTLADWSIDDEVTDDAVLCLSELVTNALIHTGGGCHVQVELYDGVLTTRVLDNGSPVAPELPPPGDPVRAHGHGLQVVAALASRWGRTAEPHSATAWFALDLTH